MSEAEGSVTQRKGLPAPDLSIAQHRVSALHSRHGQRQTIQAPQQAAEVVVATHCSCQGLLTGAGGLRGEKTIGRGPYRRARPTRLQPCCCCRARGPPAGHSGKRSLAGGGGGSPAPFPPPPNPATQATHPTVPSLDPSSEPGPSPLSGLESVHPGGPPYSGHRYLECQRGWKRGTESVGSGGQGESCWI